MKLTILALTLALAALGSASTAWTPGKEYVFEYKTRTMTGIPYIKNQVSGVGIRSKVIVQVKSPSELWVKMSDIGIGHATNQEFSGGWRNEVHLNYSPWENSEGMSIPFKVILKEGQVVKIETSASEPIYVVNIKRALASQLSLNMAKVNVQQHLSGNGIYKQQEDFYTVDYEPSIGGECKTYYTIVPLPEYISLKEEFDLPREVKEKTEERPSFIVTKTKDFTFCRKKPVFIHSSVVDINELGSSPSDAQHKRFSSRTSVSRYLIRGEPKHNFVVERVWTEGELVVKPFATKTESIFITSNQTLVLKEVESIRNPIPEPSSLVSKSLVFEMVPKHSSETYKYENEIESSERFENLRKNGKRSYEYEYEKERELERELESERQSSYRSSSIERSERIERFNKESYLYPKLTKRPQIMVASGTGHVPVRKVQEQIKELVKKVEEEIESMDNLGEKEPSLKILQISRALMVLDLEEIEEVYREIVSETHGSNVAAKTERRILLDSIAFCGSNPCVMFLKEKIQKREIKGETAAQLLMTLPVTLKTPTPEILKELVEMIKAVKSEEQVWFTALLSTSTLINRACINPKTRRHNYAVSPKTSRPYCTSEEVELLLPYLRKELQETHNPSKLMVLVQAIGNLGSPEIFEVLRPVILGQLTPETQVRSKAIFALVHNLPWSHHHSHEVKSKIFYLLKPIFSNPLEPTVIRIGAFVGLFTIDPSEAFFTEVATGTWFEQSQQVGQFVYTTLANLANSTFPLYRNLSRKASVALPMAKPYRLGAQYSKNVYFTHMIPSRNIGSLLQWAQVGSKHSLIPEIVYLSLKNHLGGFDMRMLEVAFQSQGLQSLINRLWGPEKRDELTSTGLNIHTRKDNPLEGILWFKLMGSMERAITLDTLREWAKEGWIEYSGEKEYTVNYQKTLPLEDVVMVFPTQSGLPVYVAKKTPALFSIRGTVEVEMESKRFSLRRLEYPKDVRIKLNLKPFVSFSRIIEAGIACPLSKEVFLSGYKSNVLLSLPGKFELVYKNKEVEVKMERCAKLPSKVELLYLKSYPFTAQTSFFNFLKRNIKPMTVQHTLPMKTKVFGEKWWGMYFEAKGKIDEPYMNFAGIYHLLRPHNFLTASQFIAIPHNMREMEYKLILDLSRSETKELKAKFTYSKSTAQFSWSNFEEEEKLERTYYKHRSEKSYSKIKEELESWYTSPLSVLSKHRYEDEPFSEESLKSYSVRTPESRRRLEAEEQVSSVSETESVSRSIHAEILFEGSNTRRYRSSLVLSRSVDKTREKMSFLFEREASSNLQAYRVCANAQMKYPFVPLRRHQILETPMTALGHVSVKYGRECGERQLTARIVLSQTHQQREAAERSQSAKLCSHMEQEGSPYTPACLRARREASALNKLILDVESQNLPRGLKNLTFHLDDLMKAVLYPHMTNRRLDIKNPENKFKLIVEVEPVIQTRPYPVLNAFLYKPRENTFYRVFKLSPVLEDLLPLNAEVSAFKHAADKIMGYQYLPMCQIEREWITTFDNVSYKYSLNENYHLIVKDCSKKFPVRVLAKQVSEGKLIKLSVGKFEVEITPERKVLVDGQAVHVDVNQEKIFRNLESRKTLVVVKPRPQEIEVIAPIHGIKIKSDGKHFAVLMSNMYRGRVCGLCGDMNGEKMAEFKDPEGCIRRSPVVFGNSYTIGSSQRFSESSQCVREGSFLPARSEDFQTSYSASPRRSHRETQYVTKVVPRDEERETCFSVKPVPECPIGTKPSRHVTKEIGFHCIRDGRTVHELSARARKGIVEEMFGKTVDFTEFVSVPESCEPIDMSAY